MEYFSPDNTGGKKALWFVMRDLKRPNSLEPAYLFLQQRGFEVFTPMKEVLLVRHGQKKRELRPYLQDLLFVHSERALLDPLVERTPTLQYRFGKGLGYRQPIIVPDREMAPFIAVSGLAPATKFFLPEEITPEMLGREVRIIGGPLDGTQCRLLNIRGSRKKRIMVELPELITASVEVNPEFIQFVSPDQKQQ